MRSPPKPNRPPASTIPFDADELDKKDYRLLLDDAIDSLPDFQRRIVVMLRQEIPIESKEPSVESISKGAGEIGKEHPHAS
jgi:hypothetical protein